MCLFVRDGYQVQVTQKRWIADCGGVGRWDFTNFVFEVHMKIVVGDCGGIVFRGTCTGAGYYFEACRTGTYTLGL